MVKETLSEKETYELGEMKETLALERPCLRKGWQKGLESKKM